MIRRSDSGATPVGAGALLATAARGGAAPATGVPQSAQKRPATGAPHAEQALLCAVPHDGQNLAVGATSSPQDEQLGTKGL